MCKNVKRKIQMKKILTLILCSIFLFNMNLPVVAATANSAKKATVSKSVKTTARIAFVIDGLHLRMIIFLKTSKNQSPHRYQKITTRFTRKNLYTQQTGRKPERKRFATKRFIQTQQSLSHWVI